MQVGQLQLLHFFLLFLVSTCIPPPPTHMCRYGVLFATIISWIPGTSVSYLTAAQPGGEERFDYFKRVSQSHAVCVWGGGGLSVRGWPMGFLANHL